MSTINTQPILDLIHKEAQEAADRMLKEAKGRAEDIYESSALRIATMQQETKAMAKAEADVQEDRIKRLFMLEERKDFVSMKREVIDEAFQAALAQLNQTPKDQVAQLMSDLVLSNASGKEVLQAGEVNDSFFTEAFVQNVNERLIKAGKPGQLKMDPARYPGVSGLVLKTQQSEMHCTFNALLDTKREELETRVAAILFPQEQG